MSKDITELNYQVLLQHSTQHVLVDKIMVLRRALAIAIGTLEDHDIDTSMAGEFEILTDALYETADIGEM